MKRRPDFVRMACTSASVSFREILAQDELIQALISGDVPKTRRAHLMCLLEEGPENLLKGLVEQVGELVSPEQVRNNLLKIAQELGVPDRVRAIFSSSR